MGFRVLGLGFRSLGLGVECVEMYKNLEGRKPTRMKKQRLERARHRSHKCPSCSSFGPRAQVLVPPHTYPLVVCLRHFFLK